MDVATQVKRGFRWMVAARLASQLMTWGVTLIVVRLLLPQDYGLLAAAQIALSFISLFVEAGLGSYLVQAPSVDDRDLRTCFGLALIGIVAFMGATYVAAPFVADAMHEPSLTLVMRVMSLQVLIGALATIPAAMLTRAMKFKTKSIVDTISTAVASALVLALALLGFGVWSLVWSSIAGGIVRCIGYLWAWPFLKFPSFAYDRLRRQLVFSLRYATQHFVWIYYSQVDQIIIGKMLGAEQLGYYATASSVASLPQQRLGQVANELGMAGIARTSSGGERADYLAKAGKILAVVMFPVYFGIAAVAPELVPVAFGARWANAVLPLELLSLAMPFRTLQVIPTQANIACGHIDISLGMTIRSAIVLTIACAIGIQWGVIGIGTAWVVVAPLTCIWFYARSKVATEISATMMMRSIAMPLMIASTMAIAVAASRALIPIPFPSLQGLCVSVALGAIIYAGLSWLLQKESTLLVYRFLVR